MTADKAGRQLNQILRRVKYVGPEPPPSEDEIMEIVVEEIRAGRAAKASAGEMEALDEAEAEFANDKTFHPPKPSRLGLRRPRARISTPPLRT